ncbi:hypothetical protein CBM2594_A41024 [Cupriavidus taiwanensis]|uniref:Uncharacterized protein n=1 Tax=Cupriavidus taiwanensis TaxID=164546 RepID=A0A7Z7J9I6_9BURK|nr:hypothetical protein CBM2594_A41024 [Cupriavidus taiwanensis]
MHGTEFTTPMNGLCATRDAKRA